MHNDQKDNRDSIGPITSQRENINQGNKAQKTDAREPVQRLGYLNYSISSGQRARVSNIQTNNNSGNKDA